MADLEGERARKDSDTFAKSMDKGIEAGHSSVCGCGTVGDTSPPNAKGACSVSQSPPFHWKMIGRDGGAMVSVGGILKIKILFIFCLRR